MRRILFLFIITFLCSVVHGQKTVKKGKKCRIRPMCNSDVRPVCGSNGVTYSNHCKFYNAECAALKNGTTITMQYKGRCGSPRIKKNRNKNKKVKGCPRSSKQCKIVNISKQAVCGTNNVTYPTFCHFRIAKCEAKLKREILRLKYKGKCGDPKIKRVQFCPTPNQCHNRKSHVCGSDGITYRNLCLFLVEKCKAKSNKKKLRLRNRGTCGSPTTPKPCPTSCPNKRRPVCGTDDKTYKNGCYLARTKCSLPKNQKRQLRVKHNGTCGGRRKPRRCLSIRKCRHKKGGPVCGTDGKTYPSKCHLRVVKCNIKRRRNLNKINVTLKHRGTCKNTV